jgi:hypothetical protein
VKLKNEKENNSNLFEMYKDCNLRKNRLVNGNKIGNGKYNENGNEIGYEKENENGNEIYIDNDTKLEII